MIREPSVEREPLRFGEPLRARRKHLGLTQQQVAESAGLTVNYLSLLENNRRTPSFDTLEALAEALRSTIWYFVSEAEPVPEDLSPEARRLNRQLRDLIRQLQQARDRVLQSPTHP